MSSSSIEIRRIRRFGAIAFFFFGSLCILGFWRERTIAACLFGTLSLAGMGLFGLPLTLMPLYNAWMKIAYLIGRLVTIAMLTVAYYLVITPAALIKRVITGSPLPLKPDRGASSYWVSRTEAAQPRERFTRRY
ncbi:MAG: hypothetical protein JRI41_06615 [Deltaproteobacteria bacterium]|nr:hypothetical protein [Deltaproteobacteria bacterium]RLB91434.1 MAG: hypothetical protein DRH50_11075 [Deltaproteobacteria bacterium]RLC11184.1 MAG: hypothetical protein DRH43_04730 [Deltaproteobacteria bacterium]